jgi:hypothetical protein
MWPHFSTVIVGMIVLQSVRGDDGSAPFLSAGSNVSNVRVMIPLLAMLDCFFVSFLTNLLLAPNSTFRKL